MVPFLVAAGHGAGGGWIPISFRIAHSVRHLWKYALQPHRLHHLVDEGGPLERKSALERELLRRAECP
jgi:hypothetical protein